MKRYNKATQPDALEVMHSTMYPGSEISTSEVDKSVYLPTWMLCKTHVFAPLSEIFQNEAIAQELQTKSIKRCSNN